MTLQKNVASQVVTFCLVSTVDGSPLTGASVTVKVAKDGTQAGGGGTVTELGTGQYKYVPTQAETNVTSLGLGFTATSAVPVNLQYFTIGQDPTLTTLLALLSGDLTSTMKTSVATAVWDATGASHVTAGSTGKELSDASTAGSAGAVWDVVTASHLTAGTTGAALSAAGTAAGGLLNATFVGALVKFNNVVAVTPSDTVNLTVPTDALFIGGAGTVAALLSDGVTTASFTVAASTLLPVQVLRVKSSGTTATGINALYQV